MHASVPKLTLDEKAALVSGASFWRTQAVPHAGVAAATLTDGPHGVRMQRASADHLGINDSEPATSFPTAAATGSTWDPALVEEMGRALGAEALALGVDVLLGPGINMKRSPLCGRNFEYFSEDPVLSGALGTAWVSGIQSKGVGASLKHFAANIRKPTECELTFRSTNVLSGRYTCPRSNRQSRSVSRHSHVLVQQGQRGSE
ncbi:glycoside hydrolase family 3 N-terminal domain-containing protein [Paenarthrobacter ureafaciens]|uniref:glycoside hydrolase family 3 N-terminal domain-containing protein n=1 Tax=Paenarthrobacter ureafaciens TaxID=37931 RepID=UPI001F6240A6|nr:glycoside hydrolase family 3 N-terminal domain-containing protein [Paenarthrobacter ureafaciens]